MQILLIRHGESEDDFLEEDYRGSTDLPLTAAGREQVRKMAGWVKKEYPPDVILSSPLKRAAETAEILAAEANCQMEVLDGLREGGESETLQYFRQRCEAVLAAAEAKREERIAIISHGGTITKLIESFLHLPYEHDFWFLSDNTGVHCLDYWKGKRILRFANSTAHLV
ncbi:histidine phosphatase family protein [Metabacillus sp. GX 13764]|uniref:histidine phosphatase family protein n=1 Tax=Metabacillus kandeliae TaxID=2900151 RepID=UPI001E2B6632|nr:histidine phosphatase family protein [Metabacillus kandeliae]MCD7034360.1 histidine phosphatase family protein [Metabacillus kandeliae]